MTIYTNYLGKAVDVTRRANTIKQLVRIIRKSKVQFDCIAFTGVSGALIAPAVADKLGKGIIVVRKAKDNSHHRVDAEVEVGGKTYIIIDDLICSGETITNIVGKLGGCSRFDHYTPVGVFLYSSYSYQEDGEAEFGFGCSRNFGCEELPIYATPHND